MHINYKFINIVRGDIAEICVCILRKRRYVGEDKGNKKKRKKPFKKGI